MGNFPIQPTKYAGIPRMDVTGKPIRTDAAWRAECQAVTDEEEMSNYFALIEGLEPLADRAAREYGCKYCDDSSGYITREHLDGGITVTRCPKCNNCAPDPIAAHDARKEVRVRGEWLEGLDVEVAA